MVKNISARVLHGLFLCPVISPLLDFTRKDDVAPLCFG